MHSRGRSGPRAHACIRPRTRHYGAPPVAAATAARPRRILFSSPSHQRYFAFFLTIARLCRMEVLEELRAGASLERLKECDQARREMEKGAIFHGLREGEISFNPTFKFDKGRMDVLAYDSSEKLRIPAWTDRVFFKGVIEGPRTHACMLPGAHALISSSATCRQRAVPHSPTCMLLMRA
jgi:hypothetical protein